MDGILAFVGSFGTWLKIGLGVVLGAIVALGVAAAYVSLFALPRAREAAAAAERVKISGELQAARDQAAAAKEAAQVKIDAIERTYWQKDVGRAQQLSALNQALEEKTNAKDGACRALIPASVSDALDAIGRR